MAFPFATYTDLKARFDVRVISKYASDTSVPVPILALPTNARIVAALQDASGLIMAACVKGKRYPVSVLSTLADNAQDGALLRQMTSVLAMAQLVGNRVGGVDAIDELVHGYKQALENLEDLRGGGLVFNLSGTLDATLPEGTGPDSFDPNRPTVWNPMFGRFRGFNNWSF